MLGHGIDQVHLIAAGGEPAGVGSGTSAGIDDRGGSGRQVAQNKFLRTRLLQLKPTRIETGGFIALFVIANNSLAGFRHVGTRTKMLLHCDDLFTPSVILTLPLCGCVVGRMASQAQSARIRPRRWLKRAGWALLVFAFLLGAGFACVFVRVVPPRSVRVVDALTGKPVSGVNVCMQAIATGLGSKEALRSSLSTTGADGRAFFWPSVELMGLLQSWYGYSIQVTDPKSAFIRTCGP